MTVDLSQFASLFEIGFAVHIAVAFLERIYARELPVRIDRIADRLKALERFKREIQESSVNRVERGESFCLQLAYRQVHDPVWADRNDGLLDRLYALGHDSTGRLGALKRILGLITVLSIGVVFYSITMLFLIGLEVGAVKGLSPVAGSMIVVAQLLPLPLAAGVFYLVARKMSQEVDAKLAGIGELRVMLTSPESRGAAGYVSIEEIYQRDLTRQQGLKV